MKEKRRHKRFQKRFRIRYGEHDFTQSAFTSDVSQSGMFIQGAPLPLDARCHIELHHDNKGKMHFEAQVMRRVEVPPSLRAVKKAGFGVRFLTPAELVADLLGKPDDPAPQLAISYPTPESFAAAVESEFKRGGVFFWTNSRVAPDSSQRIQIEAGWLARRCQLDVRVKAVVPGEGGRTGVTALFDDPRSALEALLSLTAVAQRE